MAVVFVHGVNNREGPAYQAGCLAIQEFLKRHLTGATVNGKTLANVDKVLFPYWGNHGVTFAWEMASLPKGGVQALGGAADTITKEILAQVKDALPGPLGAEPLTALAKQEFALAVDAVVALALESTKPGDEARIASFVVAAEAYATANPQPGWVAQMATDSQFVSRLVQEVTPAGGPQALGNPFAAIVAPIQVGAARLKQAVMQAAGTALDRSGDFASTKLMGFAREPLNGILGRFFGDIFVYMSGRGDAGTPGEIPQLIIKAFEDAKQAAPNEPLVIIAHSLGGVITYDLLGSFRPDIECDLFVSVGSQVGHFEEIKLYKASDPNIGRGKKAKTPANIKRWINIYDEVDIFSYAAKDIFDRIDLDAPYDTQTYMIKAHGAYLDQDRFYQRLRARMDQLP